MSVAVLIISHTGIGPVLLDSALATLPAPADLAIMALEIPRTLDIEPWYQRAVAAIHQLNRGDGVLVLTDIYGATPSNIGCRLIHEGEITVVTGLNLPMLLRVINYAHLGLAELAEKAISGGHEGIITLCASHPDP
jgi:mannose PTS system EIIA component